MDSEKESKTDGDNLKLKKEEAALLKWTSNFLLSDESSEDVNDIDVDHNPYNQSHETNDWMARSLPVHPHFNSPLLSPPPPPHPPSQPSTPPTPPTPPPSPPPPPPTSPPPPVSSPQKHHVLRMTTDDKPRLRWTQELHEHFVECVAQLGGPFGATPKHITRKMNVDGLTILHVKSHLQKYRATMLPNPNESAHTALSFQQHQSSLYETPIVQSTALETEMPSSQMPMQDSVCLQSQVQRSLQIREEAHEKYLKSLEKRAYDFCTPQVRASFKHQKCENFTQAPLPSPSYISAEQSDMLSHEHGKQRILEIEKEAQDKYLMQQGYDISAPQTTEGAKLNFSMCEKFSQAPFPSLTCINAEQSDMQSHSQQLTSFLPTTEEYNLSSNNAEVQTALPSGSSLHNNQHGLSGITDCYPGSPLSGLWTGVENYSFEEMDPISFGMVPGRF